MTAAGRGHGSARATFGETVEPLVVGGGSGVTIEGLN